MQRKQYCWHKSQNKKLLLLNNVTPCVAYKRKWPNTLP